MQFCTNCGRYISEHDVICPECGTVLRPEALVAEPYRHRYAVFFLSLIAFAAIAFAATFFFNAYFFFIFVPFVFFGWDRSRLLAYVLMGMSFGVAIGLIASWVYRYSGLF
jgi:hypothetical protein